MKHRALTVVTFAALLALSGSAVAQEQTGGSALDTLSSSSLFDQKLQDDSFGKAPTNIKSDSLSINAKDRVFTYRGNVEVTQGDMTLTAKTIDGIYTEDNQINKLIAKGDVVITKQDIKATAQQAIYDAPAAIVTLTDNPQLQQKESILIADRIKVFLKENRSQAEGSVRVTVVQDKEGAPGAPKAVASPSPTPAAKATPKASQTPSAKKQKSAAKKPAAKKSKKK
jgi:lipopolysaccharide export system protein LptA